MVGAGTAGANAAYQLARRGRSVVLLERRPAEQAGAQWHNAVLDWQFHEAGVEPPRPPEREAGGGVTHLVSADGHRAVTVHDAPTVRADMVRLGSRLRGLAEAAGCEIVDRVAGIELEHRGARPCAVTVSAGGGSDAAGGGVRTLRIEAALFVDASGRHGALRRQSPVLERWCPEVRGDELCTATDVTVGIASPSGARAFLDRHGALPGEGVTVVGLAGGFSTRAVTVSEDLSHAAVLVGCLANGRYSTGPRLLTETLAELDWLGPVRSGGSGVIPLRRPYARFTAPGLALVGDAAAQVFPAHGSGIGFGLIAGSLLADAVADNDDPGNGTLLWSYQATFQRRYGGLLAAFDAFRRMSTALGTRGVTRMVRAGLMTEPMARGGLDQKWQPPDPAGLPLLAARLATVPDVAAQMLPLLARGQVMVRMGARYPDTPDEAALDRWDRTVQRLLGPLPR